MLATLPHAPSDLLLKIFRSKCCHLYGFDAWRLADKNVQMFFTAWNRCVGRILRLHPATHTRFLPIMTGWCVKGQIGNTAMKMITKMATPDRGLLAFVAHLNETDKRSLIGENTAFAPRLAYEDPDPHDICLVGVIEELQMCYNGQYQCVLDNYQIKELIDDICIN